MARPGMMVVAAVVMAAALFGGWYVFLRADAPPPVSLASALASVGAPAASAESAATPAMSAESASTGAPVSAPAAAATGDPAGTWTLVAADSFAGYRVQEELASVGAATAVGRTSTITGSLVFDGSAITAVEVVADLSDLRSDDSRRDGQLRRQALQTNRFPEATFVLAEPIVLGGVPAEGETISAVALGDLTLHGVTRRVEVSLEGRLAGGLVVVVGSMEIVFADYDIDPPSAPLLLSVADRGIMELQLVFARG